MTGKRPATYRLSRDPYAVLSEPGQEPSPEGQEWAWRRRTGWAAVVGPPRPSEGDTVDTKTNEAEGVEL